MDPDPLLEPFPELELEPVFELSEEDPEFPLLEDPLDVLESPEEEFEEPLELLLEEVLSPEPELEEEPEPESVDPEPELFPLAVSEGEELDPELESLELPEFPEEEDPDVLEESEVFELFVLEEV